MNLKKTFYITTPIYYVNAELHVGHAFTTLAADTATRFHQAMGRKTFLLTGSDEHGQKVEQAAKAKGVSTKAYVDEMVEKFKVLWGKLDIRYNDFIRTTEPRHMTVVQHILSQLHAKGDIFKDSYSGWYCTPCERFWTEKDLNDSSCPECKRSVEQITETNYFFKMSKYQDRLISYIKENPGFIRPENRQNEILGFLAKPLQELCISRPKKRLAWGIDLPFDPDYVTYVWFDALTNYISAIGYPDNFEQFNELWPANCHLIGKDILTTHSVYWLTILLALGLPLPECLFAHGWWILQDGKMSKSVGNVVNPLDIIDQYGLDPFRFFLFREMVFGSDATFSEDSFILRYNADLANDLGNLCQRTLPQLIKHRERTFRKTEPAFPETHEVIALADEVKKKFISSMEDFMFHDALKFTWDLVGRLNKYIDETAPWKLAKNQEFQKLDEVFYTVGEGIRFVSHLVQPFMPHCMPEFLEQIGLPLTFQKLPDLIWGGLPDGVRCNNPKPIFPRIDTPRIAALKQKPESAPGQIEKEPEIEYEEFLKTNMCVGEIISAEKIKGADKLLKLTVKLGNEERTLVAGIALFYKPEDIVGKQVVVVKNLKPAKIRGVLSYGMILAAGTPDGGLALVQPQKPAVCGSRVK